MVHRRRTGSRSRAGSMKPANFQAGKKYPLVLVDPRRPVVACTTSASTGASRTSPPTATPCSTRIRAAAPATARTSSTASSSRYPGKDYDDLMAGVDAAIAQGLRRRAQPVRVRRQRRRRADRVDRRPHQPLRRGRGDAPGDRLGLVRRRHRRRAAGTASSRSIPWEDPIDYAERSPLAYVGNVTTPTMVMTGEIDLRTPIGQSEEFYRR